MSTLATILTDLVKLFHQPANDKTPVLRNIITTIGEEVGSETVNHLVKFDANGMAEVTANVARAAIANSDFRVDDHVKQLLIATAPPVDPALSGPYDAGRPVQLKVPPGSTDPKLMALINTATQAGDNTLVTFNWQGIAECGIRTAEHLMQTHPNLILSELLPVAEAVVEAAVPADSSTSINLGGQPEGGTGAEGAATETLPPSTDTVVDTRTPAQKRADTLAAKKANGSGDATSGSTDVTTPPDTTSGTGGSHPSEVAPGQITGDSSQPSGQPEGGTGAEGAATDVTTDANGETK